MDNKDIDKLYADLQDEIKKVLEDWWQKIKWNVENAAAGATGGAGGGTGGQSATTVPTRNGSLPWFGHGIRGFLHKLWYGDHPENPNWRAMPATESSKKRLTIQEYTVLKEQLEDWMDIFSENDVIASTKNELLNSLLGVISKYMNHAYQLGYTKNTPTSNQPSPPPGNQPDPTSSPEKLSDPPEADNFHQQDEPPIGGFDPGGNPADPRSANPPSGQAANMPRRGRGRPPLSDEERKQRKILRRKNKPIEPKSSISPPDAPPTPEQPPESNVPESPPEPTPTPTKFEPEEPGLGEENQHLVSFFSPFIRNQKPEDEKIKERQSLYDQLGIKHNNGEIIPDIKYVPILGDIILGLKEDGKIRGDNHTSSKLYTKIFGPLNSTMISGIVNYVEKKLESDENPQTNTNLHGVAANAPNESLKQIVGRYKNLLKENRSSDLAIIKSRKLPKNKRLSYFIELLK